MRGGFDLWCDKKMAKILGLFWLLFIGIYLTGIYLIVFSHFPLNVFVYLMVIPLIGPFYFNRFYGPSLDLEEKLKNIDPHFLNLLNKNWEKRLEGSPVQGKFIVGPGELLDELKRAWREASDPRVKRYRWNTVMFERSRWGSIFLFSTTLIVLSVM